MLAQVLRSLKAPLTQENWPDPVPDEGQAVVRLEAASLNRRDYWITQGLYPGISLPAVLGSDGSGVVETVGEGVDPAWIGQPVIVDAGIGWGASEAAQGRDFQVLGMPRDGTLAEKVLVDAIQLYPKPEYLTMEETACLPVGGTTAYRALFVKGELMPGHTVLITGVGGGVALLGMQMALAHGAEVWVTSSSGGKLARAEQAGARGGFNYLDSEWINAAKEQMGAPSLILDSAGGSGYSDLIQLLAPGGRMVNFGSTAGAPPQLDLFKVFWKQLSLVGSTMGSPRDFKAMMDFVSLHQIRPLIDETIPLLEANRGLARLHQSDQFGKIVIRNGA